MLDKIYRRVFGREIDTYGMSQIIRRYCAYPAHLPLTLNVHHGWYPGPPRDTDLENSLSLMLTYNKRQADEWRKVTDRPVAVVGAPFIHYRRMMGIERDPEAKGTIAYPGHVASVTDYVFDQDKFCRKLLELDEKYHPITVSVLENDIRYGKHKIYERYGFETFSPGGRNTIDFCANFYSALARHRYACGNHIGSNVLYAIEMGTPYFLVDDPGAIILRETGLPANWKTGEGQAERMARWHELFSTRVDEVTPEQRHAVIEESGMDDCLSPDELRRLILRTLFTREIPKIVPRLAMWPVNTARRVAKALS